MSRSEECDWYLCAQARDRTSFAGRDRLNASPETLREMARRSVRLNDHPIPSPFDIPRVRNVKSEPNRVAVRARLTGAWYSRGISGFGPSSHMTFAFHQCFWD